MTLVDALAALQEGAVPTNEQSVTFLSRLLLSMPNPKELSPAGSGLISDLRSIVETLDRIIKERNGGEELQEFLWRTQGAAGKLKKEGLKLKFGKGAENKTSKSIKKSEGAKTRVAHASQAVKRDGIQAAQHIRTLVRLALVQPELRHIVADVGYMLAEVVDKSTGTSIEEARGKLGQVKSATGTFQNIATRALNTSRAQKLAQNGSNGDVEATRLDVLKQVSQGAAAGMPALSALREQLSETLVNGNISVDSIRQELANGKTVPALGELRTQAQAQAGKLATGKEDLERMRREIASGTLPAEVLAALSGVDREASRVAEDHPKKKDVDADALLAPTDLMDAAQMIAVANQHLVPTSTIKDIVQSTTNNAQSSMKEAWTAERRERLIRRSRKLIVDSQGSRDYKEAVEWFISKVETIAGAVQHKVQLPSTSLDTALSSAAEPLIQLLENFAAGHSLRSILETAKKLSIGAKDNAMLQSFWRDADKDIRRCLLEEGYALTKEAERGVHDLVKRFRGLQKDYKDMVVKLVKETTSFIEAVSQDKLLRALLKASKDLVADVTLGKGGKRIISKDLFCDLRDKILPTLLDRFGVIPVPRIKYLHPDFDLVIENIAIELKYLLPDIFDMKMTNDVHLDFRKIKDSTHCHSFKIKIKGMSIRVYKLAFAVTTRMGLSFHDHGIADLLIADFGLTLYIDIPKDPGPHYFIVKNVKAKLGTLRLKIYESNHRILHAVAGNLANSYLAKRILRHFIGMGVTIGLKQLDLVLMSRHLNEQEEQGKMSMEDVRKQMAELRDLIKKYHESAGTLEVDFTREGGGGIGSNIDIGKSIEDSHAVRWVKKQVNETGRKEIVRDEWRSNAFDLDISEGKASRPFESNAAKKVDAPVKESKKAAKIRNKPEGPTDASIVRKASRELKEAEEEENGKRRHAQTSEAMESDKGKEAVNRTDNRGKQTKKLESAVEKQQT